MPLVSRLQGCQDRMQSLLRHFLPSQSLPLFSAMHYACLNGGKRLRPLLVYSSAEIFSAPWEKCDAVAAAIEIIHCYSLIHDDLPAMDNDDLRRGKPTCHKVFGEATAILAGDALLAKAFEILATPAHYDSLSESVILKIINKISHAAGAYQMVKGQAIDLEAKTLTFEDLCEMHRLKTGALIAASVQCGALTTGLAENDDLENLHNFGQAIGLSFQIQDDILDEVGDPQIMGKNAKQDHKQNKCTFVTLLGVEKARRFALDYYDQALTSLEHFGDKADPLRLLAKYMVERSQ